MAKKSKCSKWKHDFSYEGKKKHKDICCKNCGISVVDWTNERAKELDHKHYGTPFLPECGKWDHDFPHGENEDDYKVYCRKCGASLGKWSDDRFNENWVVW